MISVKKSVNQLRPYKTVWQLLHRLSMETCGPPGQRSREHNSSMFLFNLTHATPATWGKLPTIVVLPTYFYKVNHFLVFNVPTCPSLRFFFVFFKPSASDPQGAEKPVLSGFELAVSQCSLTDTSSDWTKAAKDWIPQRNCNHWRLNYCFCYLFFVNNACDCNYMPTTRLLLTL